jgi:hypothetical protein
VSSANGWGYNQGNYGFVGTGNNPNDPNFGGGHTSVNTCSVQISAATLTAVRGPAAWMTQPFVENRVYLHSVVLRVSLIRIAASFSAKAPRDCAPILRIVRRDTI